MPRHANLLVNAMAVHGLATSIGHADFIQVVDQAEWESALSAQESIFFTEYPPGTFLSDQYAGFGVTFTDGDDFITNAAGFLDCCGVNGLGAINLTFDRPRTAIAIDFPGGVQYLLYSEGELHEQYCQCAGG